MLGKVQPAHSRQGLAMLNIQSVVVVVVKLNIPLYTIQVISETRLSRQSVPLVLTTRRKEKTDTI